MVPCKALKIIANLPWALAGLAMAVLSGVRSVRTHQSPPALVISVRSFWYRTWRKANKGTRACAIGNVVLLGPKVLPKDLEHELVHIEQAMKEPFIYPIRYWLETKKHGYKKNKYEVEAYSRAGNTYLGN
jgi:hypothetical protein